MVKVSYHQKPYRRSLMQLWGASVVASPSEDTNAGRNMLAQDPDSPGSLGMAISEAVEDAALREDTKYSLGSVLNHVLLHQTVIGLEAKKQFEMADDYPDVVIGCAGGGSNFAGLAFPFVPDKLAGKKMRIVAVEPTACPTLTRGIRHYDFGDVAQMTPLLMMYTLGHDFVPSSIHAGGLRYHGVAQQVALLVKEGFMRAVACHQNPVFDALQMFAKAEGILAAPESGHAIRVAIDEALKCKESGESKAILFNLSGHGHFDMSAYEAYTNRKLEDYDLDQSIIDAAESVIPKI